MLFAQLYFFFSSRRRHTRLVSDWSSDVCSSDLPLQRNATTYLCSVTSVDGGDWRDSLYQFTRSLGFEPPGLFRREHPTPSEGRRGPHGLFMLLGDVI